MFIFIDSREKSHAITKIVDEFQRQGVRYETNKLYIGDYVEFSNPFLVIDRKQSIDELAMCCTSDHERFKREILRAQEVGAHLVILVEQSTYSDRGQRIKVESIEDLMLWESRFSTVKGERVYRILAAWVAKYPVTVEFCRKADTGRRIIEILREGAAKDVMLQ